MCWRTPVLSKMYFLNEFEVLLILLVHLRSKSIAQNVVRLYIYHTAKENRYFLIFLKAHNIEKRLKQLAWILVRSVLHVRRNIIFLRPINFYLNLMFGRNFIK
jgi:hypothetical protein